MPSVLETDRYFSGSPMSKTHTFEVYPFDPDRSHLDFLGKDRGLYWTVYVCPNKQSMYRKCRSLKGTSKIPSGFDAIVMPSVRVRFTGNKRQPTTSKCLGEVLFSASVVCGEHVTHEAVHMALEYLRRLRKATNFGSENSDREELLAYTVGHCAAQIANKLHELKLWK